MTEVTVGRRPEPAGIDPDYPIDPVPRHARRHVFSVLIVLLGFTFFTPTMLAGAQVGVAFSVWDFLGVLLLGSVVLGLYVAVLGAIGARTGLTTVVMSRYALGRVGAKGASLLLGGTQAPNWTRFARGGRLRPGSLSAWTRRLGTRTPPRQPLDHE